VAVLVPVKPSDLPMLPLVVNGIREHVRHPIAGVTIVSASTPEVREAVDALGACFVDEDSAISLRRDDVDYFPEGTDRRGWLFAQLLKLHADQITGSRFTLCCDADTVYVRPRVFLTPSGRQILEASQREYHRPYFQAYSRLTGLSPVSAVSYVAHQMLFDARVLGALREHVTRLHGSSFSEAVLECVDRDELSAFSEFETYANFLVSRVGPSGVVATPFCNREMSRAQAEAFLNRSRGRVPRWVKSISCHSWREVQGNSEAHA
jgi:hypothetical protein